MPKSSFTLYFMPPFWRGVYQREEEGQLLVAKVTFGREPTETEIYHFLLENWRRLPFGPAVKAEEPAPQHQNPKRRRREAARLLAAAGVGARTQQALQLAQKQGKEARKAKTKAEKEAEQKRRFALRTQRRKQKHRGH